MYVQTCMYVGTDLPYIHSLGLEQIANYDKSGIYNATLFYGRYSFKTRLNTTYTIFPSGDRGVQIRHSPENRGIGDGSHPR